MSDLKITYAETELTGRYSARMDGISGTAALIVKKVSPTLVIADHTEVPESMGGRGVARNLVERLISDARANGQRIVPFCPYFRAYAQKHSEDLSDVIQW